VAVESFCRQILIVIDIFFAAILRHR